MKRCNIFKTEKDYKILTESESNIGLFIIDDPIIILPINSNIEIIKTSIFKCLNSSRKNIYTPKIDEWTKFQKEDLKKMKEKSFPMLYKRSNNVFIRLEDTFLTITPGKYDPKTRAIYDIKEAKTTMNYSPDKEIEITKKIIEMLQISYKG